MENFNEILLQLPDDEAYALAQYLKRAGLSDYRQLAVNEEQAYTMQAAAERLRSALAFAGYAPR
jgi:hypothetical protein